MISDDFKTIFVHIPKTGGTSVESMFGDNIVIRQKTFRDKQPNKHWSAKRIQSQNSQKFEEYYKWTIVRNPWERELSFYNMASKGVKFRHMSFKEFLKKVTIPAVEKWRKMDDEYINICANQLSYFLDDNENIIVDKIVRYENLNAEWQNICNKIGKEYEELPHLRKAKRKPMGEYYDQECIDIVAELRKEEMLE